MNSPAKTKQLVAGTPRQHLDRRGSTLGTAKRPKNAAHGASRGYKSRKHTSPSASKVGTLTILGGAALQRCDQIRNPIHATRGINASNGRCGATWTTSTSGCRIAKRSAVAGSPPDAPEIPPRSWFPAMTHIMNSRFTTRWLAPFVAIVVLTSTASAEWKEKVLYSFQGGSDGSTPAGGVVFDKAGNLYGATTEGGAENCSPVGYCGTVYQLAPPAKEGEPWKETIFRVFKGKASNDGELPEGGVIADASGNIYGTTAYGGTGDCVLLGIKGGCGTVYEFSPPQKKGGAWTYAILYSFKGGNDGYLPVGDLVFDGVGNLYGSTEFGGGKGTTCDPGYYQYCGTVFKLSPPKNKGGKWTEQVLHSFAGGSDGAEPNGGLVLDSKGALYGTTYFGGNEQGECNGGVGGTGCGTVFRLNPSNRKGVWSEQTICRFSGQDGANPAAGVAISAKGDLYGTTFAGPENGFGTVFRLKKPLGKSHIWPESLLHRFTDGNDGANPRAGLIFDADGDLYGSTAAATNRSAQGTLFRLKESTGDGSWLLSGIYTFQGSPDGAYPAANMILGNAGSLYGTTVFGGTGTCQGGCGTVFQAGP
jgi:uncharacterized repeat protein (TIGR03803 family)